MSENILVIHQGALGDVVQSFPALLALKRERGASLVLLACNQIGQMAHGLGVVEAHFRAESARFCGLFADELSPEMRAFVSRFHGIVVFGFSDGLENRITKHHRCRISTIAPRPPVDEDMPVAVHIVKQLKATGLLNNDQCTGTLTSCLSASLWSRKTTGDVLCGRPSHKGQGEAVSHGLGALEKGNGVFGKPGKDLFVMHPGAGSVRKRWALGRFIALAGVIREVTSGDVVFLVGPAEKDLLPLLTEVAARKRMHVHQVDDLTQVAALIDETRCFVGNDSGLAQLAGFLGVPTVAIFGPSSTARWSPLGKAVAVLRGAQDCPPCFETGKGHCEGEAPRCLEDLPVETVAEAMKKLGVL